MVSLPFLVARTTAPIVSALEHLGARSGRSGLSSIAMLPINGATIRAASSNSP